MVIDAVPARSVELACAICLSAGATVINRREVLTKIPAAAAAVAGFPLYVKAQTLGRDGGVAASNRVTIGTIGMGWMGGEHLSKFTQIKQCQYVAVCDIDRDVLAAGK